MNWEKHILPYLLLFAALGISISAAIFSVTGMAKMFSGASTNVMIVIGFLEFGKLVLASAIYQYWNIFKSLRVYYVIALIFLMGLTSGGIYGFLTDAYAGTSQKLNKQEDSKDFYDSIGAVQYSIHYQPLRYYLYER